MSRSLIRIGFIISLAAFASLYGALFLNYYRFSLCESQNESALKNDLFRRVTDLVEEIDSMIGLRLINVQKACIEVLNQNRVPDESISNYVHGANYVRGFLFRLRGKVYHANISNSLSESLADSMDRIVRSDSINNASKNLYGSEYQIRASCHIINDHHYLIYAMSPTSEFGQEYSAAVMDFGVLGESISDLFEDEMQFNKILRDAIFYKYPEVFWVRLLDSQGESVFERALGNKHGNPMSYGSKILPGWRVQIWYDSKREQDLARTIDYGHFATKLTLILTIGLASYLLVFTIILYISRAKRRG
jgi:hypothetical protein